MKHRRIIIPVTAVAVVAAVSVSAAAADTAYQNTSGKIDVLETHLYGPNRRGAAYVCIRVNGLVDQGTGNEFCNGWNPASTVPGHRSETEAWAALWARADLQAQLVIVAQRTPREDD